MTCSLHKPTLRRYDVAASPRLTQREFFRYKKKNNEKNWRGGGGGGGGGVGGREKGLRDGEDDIGRFERSCNPYTCIFFL